MKSVFALCVLTVSGLMGGMTQHAFAEPQSVTITPSLRVGDVAHCNVLTTMVFDMPDQTDRFMSSMVSDAMISASQRATWTVRRIEPDYSVIVQEFANVQTASAETRSMMADMMLARYKTVIGPMECRVGKSGEIEDILNTGEVVEQFKELMKQNTPRMQEATKEFAKGAAAHDAGETAGKMLSEMMNSPEMYEKMVSANIGKPLFSGAWIWGKTLTVGQPQTSKVPPSEIAFDQVAPGGSVSAERTLTLRDVNDHEVRVSWVTNMTITIKEPPSTDVDTSKWDEKSRQEYQRARDAMRAALEPQRVVETGEMRLDRRTGMPIEGTVVTHGGNSTTSMQMVVVYSPVTK